MYYIFINVHSLVQPLDTRPEDIYMYIMIYNEHRETGWGRRGVGCGGHTCGPHTSVPRRV